MIKNMLLQFSVIKKRNNSYATHAPAIKTEQLSKHYSNDTGIALQLPVPKSKNFCRLLLDI